MYSRDTYKLLGRVGIRSTIRKPYCNFCVSLPYSADLANLALRASGEMSNSLCGMF